MNRLFAFNLNRYGHLVLIYDWGFFNSSLPRSLYSVFLTFPFPNRVHLWILVLVSWPPCSSGPGLMSSNNLSPLSGVYTGQKTTVKLLLLQAVAIWKDTKFSNEIAAPSELTPLYVIALTDGVAEWARVLANFFLVSLIGQDGPVG
jgi:hypothetical protein